MIYARCSKVAAALAAALSLAPVAQAADWPDLPPRFLAPAPALSGSRWGGFYGGAHLGRTSMTADFGNALQPIVATHLRDTALENQFSPSRWAALTPGTTSGKSYGGFGGYNIDWGDVLLGAEVAYSFINLRTSSSDSLARQVTLSDGTVDGVTITGSASVRLRDSGVIKARAGYPIGQFLPYISLGVAVGRFDYRNTATTVVTQTPSGGTPTTFTFGPTTDARENVYQAGFAGGAGLDVLITPNIFVRGEYEYVAYGKVHGTTVETHTGRVGIGVRF
ncbi:MAG: porin family protein [Pseudolabrys sp.]|nr:porin family protein [Pseudolabrys sp.]